MRKIMIVDDSAPMREIIRNIACKDYDLVLECAGGYDAVAQFPQFRPDLILMDVEMRDMDGFVATSKIIRQDPAAKIIFVTNHTTPAFEAKAQELHALGFVSKENLFLLNQLMRQ